MEKTQYYLNNGESSLICEIPDESSKYLQRKNHLSEFKTDEDKEEARDNLGITDIISKIYQSISDIDLDIAKLVKDVTYSNNAITLTFYDDSTSDPISLADLAIDGMLSNVIYIKEGDVKPEDFPEDYTDGYPCYYFQWNIEEAGQSTKKVIVVPTNNFIDIRFDYTTSEKNYGVQKNEYNQLFVNVPWVTYSEGSNIKIDSNNNINSVVPMQSITPTNGVITLQDGIYYIYESELNELIIQLPYISDITNAHGFAILFTSGDTPLITYQKKDSDIGSYSDYTPKQVLGFQIESNTTYEMTCTYINSNWYVSAIPFES